jgi:hypothetical protein
MPGNTIHERCSTYEGIMSELVYSGTRNMKREMKLLSAVNNPLEST